MLKILTTGVVCMLTLSACGAVNTLMKEHYRTRHLRFTEQEYEKSPGVLMRASVGAWGKYDEDAKLAAMMDYYTDPEGKLKSGNVRYQFGMEVEEVFDNISGSNLKKPFPQELGRAEALKRVQCLNSLFGELSKKKFRKFLNSRYPLFKAEARCSAFLARHSVPIKCAGWKLASSSKTHRHGTTRVTTYSLKGKLVNTCEP